MNKNDWFWNDAKKNEGKYKNVFSDIEEKQESINLEVCIVQIGLVIEYEWYAIMYNCKYFFLMFQEHIFLKEDLKISVPPVCDCVRRHDYGKMTRT